MQYILFFGTVLGALFLSHAFLYISLVHFFAFAGAARKVVLVILVLLSVSFFLASTLAHWYDNTLTRWFYTASATWLGMLSNAFFLFLGAWGVYLIIWLFGFHPTLPLLWISAVILALLFSVYGLYAANNVSVRYADVYIKNLPASWEGKKLVQITDVHLGHIYRDAFAARIAYFVNKENPAMVAIVGDLFDGMDGHLEGLVKPLENIHSEYGTYFITGNHETYLGTGKVIEILKKTNIKIIDDKRVDLDGLQILGVASPERGNKRDLDKVLDHIGYLRNEPSVLLYHTPTEIDAAKSLGISLQLAGHTHRGQLYPYNLITKRTFGWYDFGVYPEGNYTLSVSSGVGTWGPPMRTNSRSEIVVLTLRNAK